jgi:hypothetical protein
VFWRVWLLLYFYFIFDLLVRGVSSLPCIDLAVWLYLGPVLFGFGLSISYLGKGCPENPVVKISYLETAIQFF